MTREQILKLAENAETAGQRLVDFGGELKAYANLPDLIKEVQAGLDSLSGIVEDGHKKKKAPRRGRPPKNDSAQVAQVAKAVNQYIAENNEVEKDDEYWELAHDMIVELNPGINKDLLADILVEASR